MSRLSDVARQLVAPGKGILAADESTGTIKKRFNTIGLESTETTRRDYREMLFGATEAMSQYISGVILFDETLRQSAADGTPFVDMLKAANCLPGIKVDMGAKPLAGFEGETVTEGLDGLRERLAEYAQIGAAFAKWRGVIAIGENKPSRASIVANAHALARYAALCQEAGIVPIVEPEVLADGAPGNHTIDTCEKVTTETLAEVFEQLRTAGVALDGMILKPNMVIPGINGEKVSVAEVAERTVRTLKATVPAIVPGIAFLSGGQTCEQASANLSAMHNLGDLPWGLTFSYGRALQAEALSAWGGKHENVEAARKAFIHRAKMNALASLGQWAADLDHAA
ncbi:class I fructose-bisphosphate aldolase [Pelagibacterium xiamenense]|uniref:class I fructose-bisphosphate aldolase n=1 Tax=Pelagibacterium xiamenense TaxID=2901140 RepID=UPI001E3F82E8|nr:class I fructose-bisphosphate aldolase [Pelagibacterium xiamenense]MCD7060478.1 fructose-bisphosphate aldolase class I [Pelagibacterium xiamenense]